MLSHYNVISNIIQGAAFETHSRKLSGVHTRTGLGVLPFSHIYGLVIIAQMLPWVGDEIIVLPRYELNHMLAAIEKYKINTLFLVRQDSCPWPTPVPPQTLCPR